MSQPQPPSPGQVPGGQPPVPGGANQPAPAGGPPEPPQQGFGAPQPQVMPEQKPQYGINPNPASAPNPAGPAVPPPPSDGSASAPSGPQVIQTDAEAIDGLTKCPRCGATQITLNIASGLLYCHFCRNEWSTENANEKFHLDQGIDQLEGIVMGSGSADIVPSEKVVLTFKCSACGAEVVIDTASSTQARCHWCRNKLSMNQQVPNGAVPDMVLPFTFAKENAVKAIADFVAKRRTYANRRFKKEFNPENVLGVYLPYMVVDLNGHASFVGEGEHLTRRYTVTDSDGHSDTRYNADRYYVMRDFDIAINDMAISSSSERLDQGLDTTNNVINAIRPFDLENAVIYDSNYLTGFTSERRDTNIKELLPTIRTQAQDVARMSTNRTLNFYDRGVRWDNENFEAKGQRWVSAYLPVWLYSYYQEKPNGKSMTHYVAVNGRTGKVMGSVPIDKPKLLLVSAIIEVFGIVLGTIILIVGGIFG